MKRGAFARWALRLLAAFGLIALVVTLTPLTSWIARRLAGPWNDPTGDTLIVLGGGEMAGGFPAQDTLLRSMYAVYAYRAGHFRKIVLLGRGVGREMRSFLVLEGVPDNLLAVDDSSLSTRTNALECARILGGSGGRNVLLTSDIHMFRAVRVFRKAGIDVQPRPVPDVLKRSTAFTRRFDCFMDEAVECAKIAYYFVRRWI